MCAKIFKPETIGEYEIREEAGSWRICLANGMEMKRAPTRTSAREWAKRMGEFRQLQSEAIAEYTKAKDGAYAEYKEKRDPLWSQCEGGLNDGFVAYLRIQQSATLECCSMLDNPILDRTTQRKEEERYRRIAQQAWCDYLEKSKRVRAEYDKLESELSDKYLKVKDEAWAKLQARERELIAWFNKKEQKEHDEPVIKNEAWKQVGFDEIIKA